MKKFDSQNPGRPGKAKFDGRAGADKPNFSRGDRTDRPERAGRQYGEFPGGRQNPPRPARAVRNIPPAARADFPGHGEGAVRTLPVKPRYGEGAVRTLPVKPRYGEGAVRTLPVRPRHGEGVPKPLPDGPRAFAPRPPREDFIPAPVAENLLAGRNPIREALRTGAPLEKLLVASGDLSGAAMDIIKLSKERGVLVQTVDRVRLDQIYPAHQGMIAYRAARAYATIETMLENAKERGEEPLIVLLDGITDPHNLGAIIRSSCCAGAHGVVVPERRAAGLTPACEKAAAGALNYIPVAKVGNINRAIEELQAAGLWVIAASLEGEDALKCDLRGPIALVIGSEGDGISRLTLEKCDRRVALPVLGPIESLNASVAAGILLYQIVRARAT